MFVSATRAKSLKEAVADPWLTLRTEQQDMVCADLCSGKKLKIARWF